MAGFVTDVLMKSLLDRSCSQCLKVVIAIHIQKTQMTKRYGEYIVYYQLVIGSLIQMEMK